MIFLLKKHKVFFIILCFIKAYPISGCTAPCSTNSLIIPRSQSVDAARDLIGWQYLINLCDQDSAYSVFAFTAEYQQSFNGEQLMRSLFGNDIFSCNKKCGTLYVSGSQSTNRGSQDWLADYFGLPTDFKSAVTFCPTIKNSIFDFNMYCGLDTYTPGLFCRIHFPFVWTQWNLHAQELITNQGTNTYIPGYMAEESIDNSMLQKSFLLATDGTHGIFGDVTQDFQFGIIDGASTNIFNQSTANSSGCVNGKTAVHVADIEAAFGYNFICCDDYHVGIELCGSAPAGNRPSAVFLFEPIVGNGHHWTLGGGLTSHYIFWQGCHESSCGIWLNAHVTHLFNDCQQRSFDFKNRPNSRYALLEGFISPSTFLLAGATGTNPGGIAPNAQYAGGQTFQETYGDAIVGGLFHAINCTTLFVQSSFSVQADIALNIAYQCGGWSFDLGYNFWARSQEKICKTCTGFPSNTYALKGDAQVYGYDPNYQVHQFTYYPLSATESNSDIHAGTNTPIGTTFNTLQYDNPTIDNPQPAQTTVPDPINNPFGTAQTNTSLQPILLSDADINYCGVPRAITNRIFTHINYTGNSCNFWQPFIGIGASAEFAQKCGKNATIANPTISQWAVWLKLGVAI